MPRTSPQLSVIVPTYNEGDNIRPLCERLFKALRKAGISSAELLLMDDDSGEGTVRTEKLVTTLHGEGYPIRIHIRRKSEGRGLSSAVMLGFSLAKYDTLLVMDADLQHEPEAVPSVARPILNGEAEFTVGSRNVEGGGVPSWSLSRRLISLVATILAYPLTSCTDPMSGFFCLSRQVLKRSEGKCNVSGFKISLELQVRTCANPIVDVPITFRERVAGESKLTMKQNFQYLKQLVSLFLYKFPLTCVFFVFLFFSLIVAGTLLAFTIQGGSEL